MARTWHQIHLLAALEAARAHQELGVDTSRPIDPFAALAAAGVLVMRQRLDHVAGVYLPADETGGVPGVLINVAHPPSRQRFTAAHELAHHRRDHQATLDVDTEWIARGEDGTSDRERLAEAFAAWFLMPKRLVVATLAGLGLEAPRLQPAGAYALALELGTSYEATVRHLADMHLIVAAHRDRLLRSTPQAIKRELGAVDVMADSWKDTWVIRPSRPAWIVSALEGDAVIMELPAAPSSGYLWEAIALPDSLEFVRDEYRPEDEAALGGEGTHRFYFRVEGAGRRHVRLEMRRPWQRAAPAEAVEVEITAAPGPTAGIVQPNQLLLAA